MWSEKGRARDECGCLRLSTNSGVQGWKAEAYVEIWRIGGE